MNTATHFFMAVDDRGRPITSTEGTWKFLSATEAFEMANNVLERFEIVECTTKGVHFDHAGK